MRQIIISSASIVIPFFLLVIVLQSCSSGKEQKDSRVSDSNSDRKSDSVSLRNSLITIYKWYERSEDVNHNNFLTNNDGIDTVRLDSVVEEMRKTGFFSNEFLTNYKQIGQRTNELLKSDSTLSMVGIAFPFQDFDTWHGGQGFQPNWNDLTIVNLSINNDLASFKWTAPRWDSLDVRFKKENDKWKLSYLQFLDLKMYH
jgi:hypothetical protein